LTQIGEIGNTVAIIVFITGITEAVTFEFGLFSVGNELAVVAIIAKSILVGIGLIWVRGVWAVVGVIRDTVSIEIHA
jgi:hypothetical protein